MVVLRLSISLLFFALAGLSFVYPLKARGYLASHSRNFCDVLNLPKSSAMRSLIPNTPLWTSYLIPIFFLIGAFVTLFKIRSAIFLYAYITVIIGIVLHVPYKGNKISQCRTLGMVLIVFSCMIILYSSTDKKTNVN